MQPKFLFYLHFGAHCRYTGRYRSTGTSQISSFADLIGNPPHPGPGSCPSGARQPWELVGWLAYAIQAASSDAPRPTRPWWCGMCWAWVGFLAAAPVRPPVRLDQEATILSLVTPIAKVFMRWESSPRSLDNSASTAASFTIHEPLIQTKTPSPSISVSGPHVLGTVCVTCTQGPVSFRITITGP